MRTLRPAMVSLFVVGLLVISACKGSPAQQPEAGPQESLCAHLQDLDQQLEAIVASSASPASELEQQVGSSESIAQLAKLALLQEVFEADAEALRNDGQTQVADAVTALRDRLYDVVQRNTLAGAGSGESGTDPVMHIQEGAEAAAAASGCAGS